MIHIAKTQDIHTAAYRELYNSQRQAAASRAREVYIWKTASVNHVIKKCNTKCKGN